MCINEFQMNDRKYPKFTVIIPQKDRAEYLVHTLRTCMIQDYPNFEIIVGDDCSEDNTVEVVRELQKHDSRIKLIAHESHVGMRDNFEIALSEVKEGYVMALGGDDGLLPGCIWKMYSILKETKAELLTWSNANFVYPMSENEDSLFSVPRKTFSGIKMVNSSDFLNKISKSMFYLVDDCPMFYIKGVASIALVNRVKSRTNDGSFYYCPTPDGFSGVVLAGEVEAYAYTREPLSIGGGTSKSQGLNYRRTDEKSRKEAQQFFNDNIRRSMHKELASQPYSPLHTLMTADYLLTASDLPGWPGKFEMFTWKNLIEKTFKMLERSSFANEVLSRELKILRNIAIQHNEIALFNKLMKSTKRKLVSRIPIDGILITPNVVEYDGTKLGLNNIYDAALATKFAYEISNEINLKSMYGWIKRTIKVICNQYTYKPSLLPDIDD